MNYPEFKDAYLTNLKLLMRAGNSPREITKYAGICGELEESNFEWVERIEDELSAKAKAKGYRPSALI